ncbi:hypothetical protein BH10BDE1_BH10BDE1_19930 [soil metagenome]
MKFKAVSLPLNLVSALRSVATVERRPPPLAQRSAEKTEELRKPNSSVSTSTSSSAPQTVMQVSRHDHHNVEIKSIISLCDDSQKVVTEMFLYVPKSFEIGLVGKAEFAKDLRTRLRLSIPSTEGFDDEDFGIALLELKRANTRLEVEIQAHQAMGQEVPSDLREAVLEAAKDVAAIVAERLKRLSVQHGRQFFVSQTLVNTRASRSIGFEAFSRNLQTVRRKIEAIREAMRTKSEDARALNSLLDEYVSQLYVQYLGAIVGEFTNFDSSHEWTRHDQAPQEDLENANSSEGSTIDTDASADAARARSRQLLNALQEDEALYRRTRGLSFESETDLERERHLSRLSQLKKFFQSKTFVDVTKTQAAQKVTESTALIGTAAAAIIGATLEQLRRNNFSNFASQGLMVIAIGIILYVIRDRSKDWARTKLQKKALGLVPDFETELVADQKIFGISREWLHILSSKACEPSVDRARHSDSVLERSLRLPEDVLSTRRVFFLRPNFAGPGQLRALHENVRLNLDRHLKFMDDPFKDLTDLEADGRLTLSRSHRVYHFHMVTRTTLLKGPHARPSRLRTWIQAYRAIAGLKPLAIKSDSVHIAAHRIVLDKSGIVRVEPVL